MSGKDSQAALLFLSGSQGRLDWLISLAVWHGLERLAVWLKGWAGLAAGQARHAGLEEARLPGFFLEEQAAWLCIAGLEAWHIWAGKAKDARLLWGFGTSCMAGGLQGKQDGLLRLLKIVRCVFICNLLV